MNELKFRFWDEAYQVMRDVDSINITGNMAICNTQSKVGERSCSLDELMQSTGHADEHGTEIFEDDILKITCYPQIVSYSKVYRDGTGLIIDFLYDDYSCGLIGWVSDWIESEDGIIEIAGNIHANPDLWEKIKRGNYEIYKT